MLYLGMDSARHDDDIPNVEGLHMQFVELYGFPVPVEQWADRLTTLTCWTYNRQSILIRAMLEEMFEESDMWLVSEFPTVRHAGL